MNQPAPASPPASTSAPDAAAANSGANIRLGVLVGVLVIVLGMLGYDKLVLTPACEASFIKLEEFVEEKNSKGIKSGDGEKLQAASAYLVTMDDVHTVMKRQPTKTQNKGHYTVEHYNFWGAVPLNRNYISVVYQNDNNGKPTRHYAHYKNKSLDKSDVPNDPKELVAPPIDASKLPNTPPPGVRPSDPSADPSQPLPENDPNKPTPEENPAPAETKPAESAEEATDNSGK
jgi:hypothetical protein